MLTRLKVNGFKNLVNVDVRFGPFTCIAGANGVGKSNLFDAIHFLSALSRVSLLEAAQDVRGGRSFADIRSLFRRVGDIFEETMSFEAEMIVPRTGEDDFGQPAAATVTFLRYRLDLAFRRNENGLEILREELLPLQRGEAEAAIGFPHSEQWRDSVVSIRRDYSFVSTLVHSSGETSVVLRRDSPSGKDSELIYRLARTSPRTIIQAANAAEHPTAVLARREMQSWRLLHLEPSVLREPDKLFASSRLGEDGAHLPAMLSRLAVGDDGRTYAAVANRLSELIADVREIGVERDEKSELLTLWIKGRDDTPHEARALSEGTLRFLALAALLQDADSGGVLCLEEPESGIHPGRVPAMIRLLKDIAVDPALPAGEDNPLRQVIVNTHSPGIVAQVEDNDLLAAEPTQGSSDGARFASVAFRALPGTWRAEGIPERALLQRGRLAAYLDPFEPSPGQTGIEPEGSSGDDPPRVMDRPDVRRLFSPPGVAR